jgi:DNA-binding SARP family transcriptional activator/Flp pilus assembly protein TadD
VPNEQNGHVALRILGPLEVHDPSGGEIRSVLSQPKRLALLSYLALTSLDQYRQRDTIVALFWPEFGQARARAALRQALSWLRHELGSAVVTSRGEEEIGVAASGLWCDAVAFDDAIAAQDYERALGLYRGDLLEGVFVTGADAEFEHWLDAERTRRHQQATRAAITLAEREGAAGRMAVAVDRANRAAFLSPHDEDVHRRRLRLLAASGDRAGALAAHTAFAERLAADFGTGPSAETARVAAEVQTSHRVATLEVAAPLPLRNRRDAIQGSHAPAPQIRAPRLRSAAILAMAIVIIVVIAAPTLQRAWSRPNGDRSSAAPASPDSAARSQPNRPPGSEARPTTSNLEAWHLLLRASYALSKRGVPDLVNAHALIQQAIDLDPLYADAHAMLAQCLGGYAWYGVMPANEAFSRAEAAAKRAVALDSTNGLGHAMMGSALSFFHYRWEEAEAQFRRAIALDPENVISHNDYAIHLRALGRFDEALVEAQKAQSLDPNYRHFSWAVGYVLTLAGRDSEAVVELRQAIELDSTYTRPRFELVGALARLGRFDSAVRELSLALKLAGENEAAAVADTATGELGYRAAVRWMGAGRLKRLRDAQAHGKYVAPMQMADALLDAGDRDGTIMQIQLAFEVHDPRLTYLNSPRYRAIVVDPRVRAVLRQMNLEGR